MSYWWPAVSVLVAAMVAWQLPPSAIDGVALDLTPPDPPTGIFAQNSALQNAARILEGQVQGPEYLVFDQQGRLYTGSSLGYIQRLWPNGSLETWADVGGHPLGMAWAPNGDLLVCEPSQGLFAVDGEGRKTVLAEEADGLPIRLADAVAVSEDGQVYFTDASTKFGLYDYMYDMLEGRPNGRLLHYNPDTREVKVLLKDLYFANGLALSADGSFLLLAETNKARLLRYWLVGPRAGTVEVALDGLPGYPDNITRGRDGTFWLALPTVRDPLLEFLHLYPSLKNLLGRLPVQHLPEPKRYGYVLQLSADASPLASYQDPDGKWIFQATTATEFNGHLYIGNLDLHYIGKYKLPTTAR